MGLQKKKIKIKFTAKNVACTVVECSSSEEFYPSKHLRKKKKFFFGCWFSRWFSLLLFFYFVFDILSRKYLAGCYG